MKNNHDYNLHPAMMLAYDELQIKLKLIGLEHTRITLTVPKTADYSIDSYTVDVDFAFGSGEISGSNPRSILFGVYRLLSELGFRWIRPGENGEVVPLAPVELRHIQVSSKASSRYRGICIEGAVSKENVLEMIHWMIKQGFNGYFIQFRDGFTFFNRWYTHEHNPFLDVQEFSPEKAAQITDELRVEIRKLDMDLHMVGHGWSCEPLGICPGSWAEYDGSEFSDEVKSFIAEVNGKRELFKGIALNTNLCYGNPEVRHRMADAICSYAEKNQDVNFLHFWLADDSNNHCECSLCRDRRPSDWYVEMLNEIDRRLTVAKLDTRIVFLIYLDLLWPPETEKVINPERFVLMFAPISRSYAHPFVPASRERLLPDYQRNHLQMPADPADNLLFLNQWMTMFPGDGFDFDYHYMWDHYKDPGYYKMAKVLHKDCQNLQQIGLQGFVSCQASRVFFPHALGMTVMGRTLWDRELSFEEIEADFFISAYGKAGADAAREYFAEISDIFHPEVMRTGGTPEEHEALLKDLEKLPEVIEKIREPLAEGLVSPVAAQRESWEIVALYNDYLERLARLLTIALSGRDIVPARDELFNWLRKRELRLQHVFDMFEYFIVFNGQVLVEILNVVNKKEEEK